MRTTIIIAVVIVLLSVVGEVRAVPPKPNIPSNFTSSFILNSSINGALYYGVGSMEFNLNEEYSVLKTTEESFPGIYQTLVQIATSNGTGYQIMQGVCREMDVLKFEDYFGWVMSSRTVYEGQIEINSTKVDVWKLKTVIETIEMGVRADDPNRLVFTKYNITTPNESIVNEFIFPLDGVWLPYQCPPLSVPNRCYGDNYVCPHGGVETVKWVRFHPSTDYALANQNFADAQGDCSFICQTVSNNVHTFNNVITYYQIQVNTSWGQYGLCNNDNCVGGNGFTVGHEAAFGIPMFGGQCSSNPEYGNWYSLNGAAECLGSQNIGDNGCAWKFVSIEKSISLDCLEQIGFLDACAEDNFTFPFANSAKALINAFEGNDPSSGGCPALPPYYYNPPSSSDEQFMTEKLEDLVERQHFDLMKLLNPHHILL